MTEHGLAHTEIHEALAIADPTLESGEDGYQGWDAGPTWPNFAIDASGAMCVFQCGDVESLPLCSVYRQFGMKAWVRLIWVVAESRGIRSIGDSQTWRANFRSSKINLS